MLHSAAVPHLDFAERVARQHVRLFEQVLPAFVERYFSGDGHELRFRLQEAVQRRDLSALEGGSRPGDSALERAHFVRVNCPLEVWAAPPDGVAPWRAEYLQGSTEERGLVVWSRRVVVCASGFETEPVDTLDDALFWAVFDAYVRYFDAVAGGAASGTGREARRKDTRARAWRIAKWTIGLSAVIALAVVVALSAPREQDERRPQPRPTPPTDTRERDQREDEALSRRVREAARRQLAPREALEAVGGTPVPSNHPLLSDVTLGADPEVPGARTPPDDAVVTLFWFRPGAFQPLRLTGLSWDARGAVSVVDVSTANHLRPVGSPAPVEP